MSTEAVCFLFGIPATFFWALGLRKGLMLGVHGRMIRRELDSLPFWIVTVLWGAIALGLLVMPVLAWLGLRN